MVAGPAFLGASVAYLSKSGGAATMSERRSSRVRKPISTYTVRTELLMYSVIYYLAKYHPLYVLCALSPLRMPTIRQIAAMNGLTVFL